MREGAAAPLIDAELASRVLHRALQHGGDFAEVFCEERSGLGMAIDESRLERVQRGSERGAGVRVVREETSYFAHVDGLDEPDLERAADAVAAAARGQRREPQAAAGRRAHPLQEIAIAPGEVPAARKAELLRACDETARAAGDQVQQVQASYAEGRRRVTVANSQGRLAADDRTRVRLGVQVVARRDDAVETGFETLGGHRGFELVGDGAAERTAERAARVALTLLDADPAPAGAMPVVVGGGFGGVLFHEMTGHGLEADHIQKGASVYAGKVGEQVAEPHLEAFDDGRLPGEWGTDAIDDEGTPTQPTPVIQGGRITSYLYDLLRARKDGVASTGNGRRESFRHLPIPRMTNTYIAPGEADARGADRRGPAGFLRGLIRWRAGGPDHGRLRLRGLRGLPDRGRQGDQAVPRSDPDRQLPRGAAANRRGGLRLRHEDRVLRQGRPAGPRRDRPGPREDRRADGRGTAVG